MITNQLNRAVAENMRCRQAVDAALQGISEQCSECGLCVKQCAFLQKYGTPKKIADNWQLQGEQAPEMPFECSLCSLCTAICPVKIDPRQMFLEMRRYAAAGSQVDFVKQKSLLRYEKLGTSKRFSFYGLPAGCDTVLFPGCALAGSRPQRVMQLYEHLLNYFPHLGIVLDCCAKPSHDLGRAKYFSAMFLEMQQYLVNHSIKNILTACPSCHAVFKQYGRDFTTRTVYEILARENWQMEALPPSAPVTLQDSCVARFDPDMQQAVRKLIQARGITYGEMKHHGKKTLCCGEGGGANFVAPELAGSWVEMRRQEFNNRRIITYCAGCAQFLARVGPTAHLLDLLFDPQATLAGKIRVFRAPMTYLNRLLLKRHFRKKQLYGVSRERNVIHQIS